MGFMDQNQAEQPKLIMKTPYAALRTNTRKNKLNSFWKPQMNPYLPKQS